MKRGDSEGPSCLLFKTLSAGFLLVKPPPAHIQFYIQISSFPEIVVKIIFSLLILIKLSTRILFGSFFFLRGYLNLPRHLLVILDVPGLEADNLNQSEFKGPWERTLPDLFSFSYTLPIHGPGQIFFKSGGFSLPYLFRFPQTPPKYSTSCLVLTALDRCANSQGP